MGLGGMVRENGVCYSVYCKLEPRVDESGVLLEAEVVKREGPLKYVVGDWGPSGQPLNYWRISGADLELIYSFSFQETSLV